MASERRLSGACELHEAIAGTAVLLCYPGSLRWWLAMVRTMVDTAVSQWRSARPSLLKPIGLTSPSS